MVSCASRPFTPPSPAPTKWQRVEVVAGKIPPDDHPAGDGFRAGAWKRVTRLGLRERWERPLYLDGAAAHRAGV